MGIPKKRMAPPVERKRSVGEHTRLNSVYDRYNEVDNYG